MAILSTWVLAALLNAAWQIPLVLAAVSMGSRLLRSSPARQHVLWLCAFALCCAAPVASLRSYRGAAVASVPGRPGPVTLVATAHLPVPITADSAGGRIILGAYLVSVVWAAGRLAASWRRTRQSVAGARKVDLPPEFSVAAAKCQASLGAPPPEVLCSPTAATPFICGTTRPAIVLPESVREAASADAALAILGHETAHVRRRDFLWNAIVESIFPLVAFHPAAHWIRRGVRCARELACDDLVTSHLLDGSRYAASLLDVALMTASAPALNPSLGTVGLGALEDRVRRLVVPASGKAAAPVLRAALAAVLLLAAGAASMAFAFQPSDPRDYTGVWRENWAAGRMRIPFDPAECCYQTLDIRYRDGRFSGTITNDYADTRDNRLVRAGTRTEQLLDPHLEGGVLQFRQKFGGRDRIFEVTLDRDGRALVRSHLVQPEHDWTPLARVR